MPAPNAWISDLAAVSTDDVWAVGYRPTADTWEPVIEHWDGAAWSMVASPDPPNEQGDFFTSISAAASDDVWAVGYARDTLYYPSRTIIEHWDGRRWRVVDSPDPGLVQNGLFGVSADATDDAWAVGLASPHDGIELTRPLLLRWDGTHWSRVSSKSGDDG